MDKISLQNFQAHKKSVVELADTITSIVGKSDHGKSSVLRSIKFIKDNKPNGTAFIRKGTKGSLVTIDTIEHRRTKTVNSYTIGDNTYKALRGAVPEEVTQALNISDVGVQWQHEPPFLLMDSPGKVAKQLSKLVDLDATTNALAFIKAKKRHHKSKESVLVKSIEETELQLSNLEHVDKADKELSKLERKGALIEKLREKRSQLCIAHENTVQAEYKLSLIPSTSALKPAKQIQKHYEELQILMEQRDRLEEVTQEIVSLGYLLSFDPTKLLKKAKRLNKLKDKLENLARAHLNAEAYQIKIKQLEGKEAKLKKIKDEMLKDTCPLCGRG